VQELPVFPDHPEIRKFPSFFLTLKILVEKFSLGSKMQSQLAWHYKI
jgi:hypothetical protein